MTPLERRATLGLGSVYSLRMLGMFMVLPVITTYGMALQGASETLIGLAIGIYGLMQAVFQIPFGLWSDKIGRKPLIVIGLILFALGSVLAAVSHSIWGVILGRALQGSGAIAAAVMALLSDLTREQNRTKAMAFIGVSFGITFAVAMGLGPVITHAFGLNGLFWLIALLSLVGIAITLFLVPNSSQHVLNRESGMVSGGFRLVLTNPQLLKLNVCIFCMHVLLMATFVALPIELQASGLPVSKHWLVYSITMLAGFIAIIPLIIYAEKAHRMRRVLIGSVGVLLLAECVLWQASARLWFLVAGVQLFFIAFNLVEALLPSLVSKESPAGYKGTAMGVYSTSQFLGVAAGGIISGWLAEHLAVSAVFLAGAFLCVLWGVVCVSMREPPYLANVRLALPNEWVDAEDLQRQLLQQAGVCQALVAADEGGVYLKIDKQLTTRQQLEAFLAAYSNKSD